MSTADIGLLIARIGVGGIMLAHGLQKLAQTSIPEVQGMVEGIGFPLPNLFGAALPFAEIAVGLLLLAGLLTRIAGVTTAFIGVVAAVTIHLPAGFFVADGGYEFVLLLALLGVALALTGSGRLGLDNLLRRRPRRARRNERSDLGTATRTPA